MIENKNVLLRGGVVSWYVGERRTSSVNKQQLMKSFETEVALVVVTCSG